jgi:medium-chain acyl-[acyl-carrier-protein] hydrolase
MTSEKRSNLWWHLARPNQCAAFTLLCFPYAGGNASIFRSWQSTLPDSVDVCGIQLPGRMNRFLEPPFRRLPDLVRELAPALLPLLERPFIFFGHSMGATLSFEVARWLRRSRKIVPRLLIVSGRRAPQVPDTNPPIHLMNDADFLGRIRERNGPSTELLCNPELLPLLLPALRADTELSETYRYVDEPPLACPITAFAGANDCDESADQMREWRVQTTNRFSLHCIDGDHFFIHSNERQLLNLLGMELTRFLL